MHFMYSIINFVWIYYCQIAIEDSAKRSLFWTVFLEKQEGDGEEVFLCTVNLVVSPHSVFFVPLSTEVWPSLRKLINDRQLIKWNEWWWIFSQEAHKFTIKCLCTCPSKLWEVPTMSMALLSNFNNTLSF